MMYWGNGMGGVSMVLMGVGGLLFWGLIVLALVTAYRAAPGRDGRSGATAVPAPTPQQVLADRFARGEIDAEEYTRSLQVLRTAPGS